MDIQVVFDNKTASNEYLSGWGLSLLIGETILFDTGQRGDYLMYNLHSLKADINKIEHVILSHEHFDHSGGLWDLLKTRKGMAVHGCLHFTEDFKKMVRALGSRFVEDDFFGEIIPGIRTTGELVGFDGYAHLPEQALCIGGRKKMSIITGCAHYGIEDLMRKVSIELADTIDLVMGGFHMLGYSRDMIVSTVQLFQQAGVRRVCPMHCTGDDAIDSFRKTYGTSFVDGMVGITVAL